MRKFYDKYQRVPYTKTYNSVDRRESHMRKHIVLQQNISEFSIKTVSSMDRIESCIQKHKVLQ